MRKQLSKIYKGLTIKDIINDVVKLELKCTDDGGLDLIFEPFHRVSHINKQETESLFFGENNE